MEWKVKFSDYLKFNGMKEGIEERKQLKKAEKHLGKRIIGCALEDSMQSIIEDGGVMKVDKLSPQYDIGFGADFKFSYKKGEKNYSFFVDVTAASKSSIQFFGLNGELTNSLNKAFCYNTDQFSLFFGVKDRNNGFFFYEKPVITLVIKRFGEGIDIDKVEISHGTNISNVLIALHEHLCSQGYGIRASHYIRPNIKRFYDDYKKHKEEGRV